MSTRVVVTGGSAGLGYFTAERLARTGTRVTIAARSVERADRAVASIRAFVPRARVDRDRLDLADLASVRDAAAELVADGPIDGVVLNAGVLPWDRPSPTADGLEPVFGVNQLGHFALLAQLFPALSDDAGVVSLGSVTHRGKRLDLDQPQRRRRDAYGHSKLAVMTTAIELDRRARAAGRRVRSVIAHPGRASGALDPARPGITVRSAVPGFSLAIRGFAHSKEAGAAISVHALRHGLGGHCYGPDGRLLGLRGGPVAQELRGPVLDPQAGARLWALSEELTGVRFEVSGRA
ncbi:MAG: SDR family NAD(P)-dependent oxidoreductase [Microbacteriaceae bacterium]|nr:SDR family NAD(P)-dependent oxidoreductase [Microbacteriaceae bacterium]